MVDRKRGPVSGGPAPQKDGTLDIELNKAPISWDLESGSLSFFGIDSALFWTDPSLVYMLAPLAAEVGNDIFRLLIAYSSSRGTEEDYHSMVSTLGDSFGDGFLAWGRAVSAAGWGTFEMPEYDQDAKTATVVVHNSWEINTQRNRPTNERWGAPFIQGKIIGIFSHALGTRCWADDICNYDAPAPHVTLKVYPSEKTIEDEIAKLRYERMMAREQELTDKVDERTSALQKANLKIEKYSRTLEEKVGERTADLVETNKKLQCEIETRKEAELKKEQLILDLRKTLNEIKTLRGLLPICSSCKKIRDDKGYWNQIESYIRDHSEAEFSHGLCPECYQAELKKLDAMGWQKKDDS
jgi:hypothetical protein